MLVSLLATRFKQLYRELRDVGPFRLLFVMALVALAGLVIYTQTAEKYTARYTVLGLLVLITVLQIKRGDKLFLKTHFPRYKWFIVSEYVLLSTPVLACLLIHKQWEAMALLVLLCIIVQLEIKIATRNLTTRLQSLIPYDAIEWKAGVRKQFFILVPVWLLAAIFSFYVGSVPMGLVVLGLSTMGFYDKSEPLSILLSYELGPQKLLQLKMKRHVQLFSITTAPLLLLFLVFHPDKWYIPVAIWLICTIIHVYAILTRYAFYSPNEKSAAAQTFMGIGAVSVFVPFFLAVLLALAVWFYFKSINNLKVYLHDYAQ